MSLTVVGYLDGKPQYRDDGPSYARRQGHGGAAMGAFSGVKLTAHQRRDLAPRKTLTRQAARKAVAG